MEGLSSTLCGKSAIMVLEVGPTMVGPPGFFSPGLLLFGHFSPFSCFDIFGVAVLRVLVQSRGYRNIHLTGIDAVRCGRWRWSGCVPSPSDFH